MNWARRLRWQVAAPVVATLAALATAALPAAAQAAGPPGPGAAPKVSAFSGIHGLTAGPAAAQQAPVLPLAGDTPAVAAGDPSAPLIFAYTGSDSHAYFAPLTSTVTATQSLGGSLVGGPGLTFVPAPSGSFTDAFARGAVSNQLYLYTTGTNWFPLGGTLTSRPGAAGGALSVSGGESEDAVVRGPDGAVWDREGTPAGTKPWRSLGGRTLAGSGPAAVNVGGTLYVLALDTAGTVFVNRSTDGAHWSGWRSLGGTASGDVGAATPAPGVGVVFVRGPGNALFYKEFAGTTAGVTPGWHSLGGSLTSGAGAGSVPHGKTAVVVLGPDGHIFARAGIWPALGNWTRLF